MSETSLSKQEPTNQEPIDQEPTLAEEADEWLEEEPEELPPRPRRRLLGISGNPIPLGLLGVLLIACGFIAGVQVEKGEVPARSSPSAGAGRLAAALSAARTQGGGGLGLGGGAGGGGGGATVGQVAYLSGKDLYVSTLEGNTVKVLAAAAQITKSVSTSVRHVHPGDTVIVTGRTAADGAIVASAIRDGGSVGASSGAPGGGGEPALFGK